MKAEEAAWVDIANHYNSHRTELLAEISKLESIKMKGKQRALDDDWTVNEADLPSHFKSSSNIGLARKIVEPEAGKKSALTTRLESLEYTVRSPLFVCLMSSLIVCVDGSTTDADEFGTGDYARF